MCPERHNDRLSVVIDDLAPDLCVGNTVGGRSPIRALRTGAWL